MYQLAFHPFPFQVGVVMLSITCHVWKIVPDLYEAIISMNSGDSECQEEVGEENKNSSSVVSLSHCTRCEYLSRH